MELDILRPYLHARTRLALTRTCRKEYQEGRLLFLVSRYKGGRIPYLPSQEWKGRDLDIVLELLLNGAAIGEWQGPWHSQRGYRFELRAVCPTPVTELREEWHYAVYRYGTSEKTWTKEFIKTVGCRCARLSEEGLPQRLRSLL